MRISDWSSDVCSSDLLVAAGTDEGQCALRTARFVTAMPTRGVIDFYYAHAGASGFSAEHRADDDMNTQIGRAHVSTPVTNAHLVCRLLLENKNHTSAQ